MPNSNLNLLENFDKTPTIPILCFEAFVIFGTLVLLILLSRIKNRILFRYFIMACGVIIFEIFTAPMWNNYKLGFWAYVYRDVSWVLTLGWASMLLTTVLVVDRFFNKLKGWQKFGLYLTILIVLVSIAESVVVGLGIRSYAPEIMTAVSGRYLFNIPIESLYYVPVFTALVISFYKYWVLYIDKDPIVPIKQQSWFRNLMISFVAVFFFELMIDPMVVNANLPSWSYIYRDISIIMTGIWILIIWLSTSLIDKYFIHLDLAKRFTLYLIVGTAFLLPLEAWFITNGYRVYGPSAVENFIGINTPLFNIPIEVVLAFPIYLALVIAFIRYWEINWDNN